MSAVQGLSPAEQDEVLRFIGFLKERGVPSPFIQAADEFIAEHPEILQRLAQ